MSIIECRNKDALLLNPNLTFGDWSTRLQEKITLNDGDSIICRNSFIDTKASSDQKIVIPTDLNITMEFYMYMVNYRGAVNVKGGTTAAGQEEYYTNTGSSWILSINPGPPLADFPTPASSRSGNDLEKYVVCSKKAVAINAFYHISEMTFNTVYAFQDCGGFDIFFRYYNIEGNVVVTKVYLEKNDAFSPQKVNFEYRFSITYEDKIPAGNTQNIECFLEESCDTRFDPPRGTSPGSTTIHDDTRAHNIPVGTLVADNVYTPELFTKTFVLPSANYSADDLTATMNRLMTEVGKTITSSDLTDNSFITELGGGSNKPYNNLVKISDGSDSNIYGYTINEAANFKVWCGASQVELGFDPDSKKFVFNYSHLPLYQDASIAVGYVKPLWTAGNNGNEGSVGSVKNYSGILFNKLFATRVDNGEAFSFWDNILGFDLDRQIRKEGVAPVTNPNCIYTSYRMKVGTINDEKSTFPIYDTTFPTAGLQFTQGFQGIDTAIQKGNSANNDPTAGTPFYKPISLTAAGEVFSTAPDTDGIVAIRSILAVDDPNLAFGYFLIEVKAQFNNNFITVDENKSDIVAIVSRYYHESNYTSSASDASLVYTHKGEPVLLNAFNCRILNSDKKLAVNIGLDNTIFLEVVKGQQSSLKALKK
jgi:hypothetical protein